MVKKNYEDKGKENNNKKNSSEDDYENFEEDGNRIIDRELKETPQDACTAISLDTGDTDYLCKLTY